MIDCLYKIIAKLLATRLKLVLGNVISPCQSAFLPKRQILDGALIAYETIDLVKRRKGQCLLLKVDFEKVYDSVDWDFLDYMLSRLGFSGTWRRWMRACIRSSTMSVLVNGSPTADFHEMRGMRQGDPLAPFLFLITAEGLCGLVHRAVDSGLFTEYKAFPEVSSPILQYANDTIIMCEPLVHKIYFEGF